MRRGGRRPGTGTSFIDAFTAEVLLQVSANERGDTLIAYSLYDSVGTLVADSGGLQDFAKGDEVRGGDDELLLLIPNSLEDHIEYRLYSHLGALLTCSDGIRTQLFGGIRVEGIKPAGRVPLPTPTLAAVAAPEAAAPEVQVQNSIQDEELAEAVASLALEWQNGGLRDPLPAPTGAPWCSIPGCTAMSYVELRMIETTRNLCYKHFHSVKADLERGTHP